MERQRTLIVLTEYLAARQEGRGETWVPTISQGALLAAGGFPAVSKYGDNMGRSRRRRQLMERPPWLFLCPVDEKTL